MIMNIITVFFSSLVSLKVTNSLHHLRMFIHFPHS